MAEQIKERAAGQTTEKITGQTAERITDETMEYVEILAKLELTGEERRQAKADMSRMLDYIDQLNELDTEGVEPMTHIFPVSNVFREDEEENRWSREAILENAPKQKDGFFQVPKTVE